ncbi:hypothetical protein [Streptomyces sp. 3N207]|uniref:hypothetical protein n=1 Tax=Streptomyces sp. 3N207 TaxID=3457417 RepID=UPI003FD466C1
MKMKSAVVAAVVVCGLSMPASAVGASVTTEPTPSPAAAGPAQPPSHAATALDELADKATRKVQEKYPDAVLWVASGESPQGPTRDMSKMTKWIFVYNTMEEEGPASVRVLADIDGTMEEPEEYDHPFWGVAPIGTTRVGMTLDQAFERLKQAESDSKYQFTALVRPYDEEGGETADREWRFNNGYHGACGLGVNVENGNVSPYC